MCISRNKIWTPKTYLKHLLRRYLEDQGYLKHPDWVQASWGHWHCRCWHFAPSHGHARGRRKNPRPLRGSECYCVPYPRRGGNWDRTNFPHLNFWPQGINIWFLMVDSFPDIEYWTGYNPSILTVYHYSFNPSITCSCFGHPNLSRNLC